MFLILEEKELLYIVRSELKIWKHAEKILDHDARAQLPLNILLGSTSTLARSYTFQRLDCFHLQDLIKTKESETEFQHNFIKLKNLTHATALYKCTTTSKL